MQTYWRRGVLFNRKGKCCMIHAPPFCCNVYIGTPWVLSHPRVITVNKTPVMLCCPLFLLVFVGCVLFGGLVSKLSVYCCSPLSCWFVVILML